METPPAAAPEIAEFQALLESVFERYGLDFRSYSQASLKRRVMRQVAAEKVKNIPELQALVLAEPACLQRLAAAMTIHVTSMFRDPGFYRALRTEVMPVLRTYPFLRIWVAGCSTGEEVYSLAILLHEEGLYERCRLYATDLNEAVLEKARAGVFPLSAMREYTHNYQKAGGHAAFAEYYTADSDAVVFRPVLRQNIVFAAHNLASDASFNEFHVILCRNVMIYFDRSLQDRVHKLFHESLAQYGYLGLGRAETVRFSHCENCYETVSLKERVYRKIR